MSEPAEPSEIAQRQWYILRRWQTYSGELRVLLLRVLTVVVLYGCQLGHHFLVLSGGAREANLRFQQGATAAAMLLVAVSFFTLLLLLKRILPVWLAYLTTSIDLLAIAAIIGLAGGPMQTMLTGTLYLVIALAGLRFDLFLVRWSTVGAMMAWMASVAMVDDSWFDAQHAVPLIHQAVALASLAATGFAVGQMVRLARGMAEDFHQRMLDRQQGAAS